MNEVCMEDLFHINMLEGMEHGLRIQKSEFRIQKKKLGQVFLFSWLLSPDSLLLKVLLGIFCPGIRDVYSLFLPECFPLAQDAQRLTGLLDAHGCEQCIDQAGSSCE